MANEDGPTQARNLFQQQAEQQAKQMEADAAVEAINSSVPESGLQQLLRESDASFGEKRSASIPCEHHSDVQRQQARSSRNNSIREAQKGYLSRGAMALNNWHLRCGYCLSKCTMSCWVTSPPAT